ncbi:MAG: hypothetical protein F4040_05010, partial [Synechococcus sp. SB0670_bin_20]|nr:hypothetical protein [Synechococcus sp. SB0670_bin_20]
MAPTPEAGMFCAAFRMERFSPASVAHRLFPAPLSGTGVRVDLPLSGFRGVGRIVSMVNVRAKPWPGARRASGALTWAIARVVKGRGPRDANKHNNYSTDLTTVPGISAILGPDAGCRMPDAGCRMPDAGWPPLRPWGPAMKVSPLGWQRRVRPCSPLLPLLLGLPLLVALVRPAAAQTERLLVGNLNQNDNLQLGLSFDIAQGFTTGVRPASLRSVEVSFDFLIPDSMPRLDQLAVGIYTSSNGQPGSRVGALTNPATWGTILRGGDPARTYLFTTAGIRLEPNTEYFVVIDSASSLSDGGNGGINLALSHDEDAGGLSNWSIDDSLMTRLSIDSTSNWVSQRAVFVNRTLKFSLTGIELPGGTTEGHSTLSLSGPAAALEEGDSGVRKLEYTVSLSEAIASRVFWKVCFSTNTRSGRATLDTSGGNSFQANADYRVREGHKTAVPSTKACTDNYQFKSSDTSRKELFYAEIKGDTDREPDEDIVATLEIVGSTPADVTLGTRWHVHRIENDDNGSQSLVINPSTVALTEGQSGTFSVKLSEAPNPSNRAVEVLIADSYQLGSDQRAYIPSLGNPRLIVSPVSLRFTNADWNSAKTFTVTAGEDADLDDETETLRLRAKQSSGNFTNLTAAVPLSITDVSNRPVVSFGSAASSVGEDAGKRNVRVNLSPAPLSAITLLYTVGGTARAGTDFNIANSGSIQVAANATRVNIPVSITDDTDDESAETVILTLGSGTGYRVGS